ncbi:N-(5'-phosphoribosyl)anthranilate isomerase [Anianabacter salinae]|uniref:N-(5'-phosphoribosyl)anthranilate isomerase n=1 Tax=Anianabacter salinae TaxID=2851023 RepID=UPI00225E174A|nr:N-(5'-phosphoribosyl)anthranilate isomerase [Anianabacter salinae]MBV0912739.1 N-(5'-phosphoribosyl)anthranilate isomerase [Anianabacter salinae]
MSYTRHAIPPQTPDDWFRHLLGARAALDGGVVRRKTRDMERMVGRARFVKEIERRGYTVLENAGQLVIFCNSEPVVLLTGRGGRLS